MNNFIDKVENLIYKKNILLEYEVKENEKLFISELCLNYYEKKYHITYSFYLQEYEEAVDLYEMYIHKSFTFIDEMYDFLECEKKIDLIKFEKLL